MINSLADKKLPKRRGVAVAGFALRALVFAIIFSFGAQDLAFAQTQKTFLQRMELWAENRKETGSSLYQVLSDRMVDTRINLLVVTNETTDKANQTMVHAYPVPRSGSDECVLSYHFEVKGRYKRDFSNDWAKVYLFKGNSIVEELDSVTRLYAPGEDTRVVKKSGISLASKYLTGEYRIVLVIGDDSFSDDTEKDVEISCPQNSRLSAPSSGPLPGLPSEGPLPGLPYSSEAN